MCVPSTGQLQTVQHGVTFASHRNRVRRRAGIGNAVGAGRGTIRVVDRADGPVRRDEEGGVGKLLTKRRRGEVDERE